AFRQHISHQPASFDCSTPTLPLRVIGMFRGIGASLCFSKHRTSIAMCAALFVCFSGGCSSSGTYTVPKADEETRVTSPNGELDAVLTREDFGASGGWE